MPICISDYPVYLQEGLQSDRERLKFQGCQKEDRKALHRDSLEVSQLSKNREIAMDKMEHTVMRSATSFRDMRAGILKEIREGKGQYGYSDVVNVCGLCYAKLCSEIEKRHGNEQERYYNADGTFLTKKDEIEWLDMQYEQEIEWQKSCARIAVQGQVFLGNISEMPAKEMDELEDAFYQARDAYVKLYHEGKQDGRPLVLQDFAFGNGRMYEVLDSLKVYLYGESHAGGRMESEAKSGAKRDTISIFVAGQQFFTLPISWKAMVDPYNA